MPERRVLWAEEMTRPKALKRESVCKEQQGDEVREAAGPRHLRVSK